MRFFHPCGGAWLLAHKTDLNIPQHSNDNKFDLILSLNNSFIKPALLVNNFKEIEKFDSSVSIGNIKNRE